MHKTRLIKILAVMTTCTMLTACGNINKDTSVNGSEIEQSTEETGEESNKENRDDIIQRYIVEQYNKENSMTNCHIAFNFGIETRELRDTNNGQEENNKEPRAEEESETNNINIPYMTAVVVAGSDIYNNKATINGGIEGYLVNNGSYNLNKTFELYTDDEWQYARQDGVWTKSYNSDDNLNRLPLILCSLDENKFSPESAEYQLDENAEETTLITTLGQSLTDTAIGNLCNEISLIVPKDVFKAPSFSETIEAVKNTEVTYVFSTKDRQTRMVREFVDTIHIPVQPIDLDSNMELMITFSIFVSEHGEMVDNTSNIPNEALVDAVNDEQGGMIYSLDNTIRTSDRESEEETSAKNEMTSTGETENIEETTTEQ